MDQDLEIQTMAQVNALISKLDPDAAKRVIHWVAAKFSAGQVIPRSNATNLPSDAGNGEQAIDLATLFDQANPTTQGEKVLIVSYWFQELKGISGIDAAVVNTELKHLGHGIPNITRAYQSLIKMKPALAMQVRKTGSSQQARKKYKITTEGIKRVKSMLNGQREDGGVDGS